QRHPFNIIIALSYLDVALFYMGRLKADSKVNRPSGAVAYGNRQDDLLQSWYATGTFNKITHERTTDTQPTRFRGDIHTPHPAPMAGFLPSVLTKRDRTD